MSDHLRDPELDELVRQLNRKSASDALSDEEEPIPRPSLLELLATWEPLDEKLPEIDDLKPIEDVDL